VVGRRATAEKSDEITAISLMLKHLALKIALVARDALGTRTEIARAIRDERMSLKKNGPPSRLRSSGCSTIRRTI
jgi:predicted transposase YbfD/YdcC